MPQKSEFTQFPSTPRGVPGALFNGREFVDEYLDTLTGNQASLIYDRMRRSDSQIKRILRLINSIVRGAQFQVSPIDANDKEQSRQAAFKNAVLNKWMTTNWPESLNNILSYLTFGFAVFEPSQHIVDDPEFGPIITIKDLGFRRQKSIYYWDLNPDGTINWVNQKAYSGTNTTDVNIPGNDILLFTNDLEGNNWEGVSLLRPCYGSYKRKELYLKLDMIGLEKNAIGTPVFFVPERILNDPEELQNLKNVGKRITSHESAYVILPQQMAEGGFVIMKGEYDSAAVTASIERENVAILDSILGSFLDIGSKRAGGNSQTSALISLFMDSIAAIADYIADKLDPLIHKTYALNFGEPEVVLKLEASGVNKRDAKEYSEIIKTYTDAGYLKPDAAIESMIRADLDLPPIDDEKRAKDQDKPPTPQEKTPDASTPKTAPDDLKLELRQIVGPAGTYELNLDTRQPTSAEAATDLDRIKADFDRFDAEYARIVTEGASKMASKYVADVRSALKQSNPVKAISAIEVGYTAQMIADLNRLMRDIVAAGREQASIESAKILNAKPSQNVTDFDDRVSVLLGVLAAKVRTSVFNIAAKLRGIGESSSMGAILDVQPTELVVNTTQTALAQVVQSPELPASSGALVPEALNGGRNVEFSVALGAEQPYQFSAILDARTTPLCRSLDGQIFLFSDPLARQWRPPLHFNCRSVALPVTLNPGQGLTGLRPKDVEVKGKTMTAEEVGKTKQFSTADLEMAKLLALPMGAIINRDGVEYIKDPDGIFRIWRE